MVRGASFGRDGKDGRARTIPSWKSVESRSILAVWRLELVER